MRKLVSPGTIASLSPVVSSASEGQVLNFPDFAHRVILKVPSEATSGAFAIAEVVSQPGGGVPLHRHDREDEIFYVCEGRFVFQIGSDIFEAGPGATIFGPRGMVHSWRCLGQSEGRLIAIFTPGHFQNFLINLAQLPPAGDPSSEDRLAALCSVYGICFGGGASAAYLRRPSPPIYVPAHGGQFFDLGDHRGWGKVGSAQTGGALLLGESEVDPYGGVPSHLHRYEDETFVVLEGCFSLAIGDYTREVGPGDIAFAPRQIPHSWRCISETPGRMLAVITPGANFEAYVTEMATQRLSPGQAAIDPTVAAEFLALAERYGMTFLYGGHSGN